MMLNWETWFCPIHTYKQEALIRVSTQGSLPHLPDAPAHDLGIVLPFLYFNVFEPSSESESESRSVVSDPLWPHELYGPWDSAGQNTGVGSLSLLQGIFPSQGSNPSLPHCRQILYELSRQGNPRILEWVAYPFFSGSSWPRNQTGVSCTASRFFTYWVIREALIIWRPIQIYAWFSLFMVHACALSHFSHVWLFMVLWTVALPGSSVHGILHARILEWVAILQGIFPT